jgi:MFS family permease
MTGNLQSTGALTLLRDNAPFRALWLSRSVSFIGDSLGMIALLLFVARDAGSGVAVALLLLVGDFAPTILSPFSGALSDRLDRKRLMIASELAQGAIITLIALIDMPLPALLGFVALRTTFAGIFQPASRSSVTALVRKDRLESANAVLGFGTHGFDLIGPLLGAAILPFVGVRGMLLADAATFLISALLLMRLPALPSVTLEDERLSFLREAGHGMKYLWKIPALRVITVGFCALVAFSGSDDVALVFLAQGPLGGGESAASLLYAGAGTGLLIGFLLIAGFGARVPTAILMLAGFAIGSTGNLLTGLSWALPVAFAMQVVRGLGISLIEVATNTLVQQIVPADMQGRVFANLYGAIGLAPGLSYAVGGILLDASGPRLLLIIAGLGGSAATAWTALRLPPGIGSDPAGDRMQFPMPTGGTKPHKPPVTDGTRWTAYNRTPCGKVGDLPHLVGEDLVSSRITEQGVQRRAAFARILWIRPCGALLPRYAVNGHANRSSAD